VKPVTLATLREMKARGEKIACLTAYDYSFARLLDGAGVDLIMVGDSLGMVMQGHDSTLPVSVADMVYHARCARPGIGRALFAVDLPFLSYQQSPEQALMSAGRLMRKGGAQVVKLEGGAPMVPTVKFLTERGIPVCAHVGLTPQSVHQLGGYKVQGREEKAAEQIRKDAKLLEEAGAGLIVLEAVPVVLAKSISLDLTIPTIGIGAGPDCDGQILVLQDMLGLSARTPKFVKNFMDGAGSIEQAVKNYVAAVKARSFPGPEHTYA
jgi:3-methyl-2-oxobutanoate hydroxymethyltransferase